MARDYGDRHAGGKKIEDLLGEPCSEDTLHKAGTSDLVSASDHISDHAEDERVERCQALDCAQSGEASLDKVPMNVVGSIVGSYFAHLGTDLNFVGSCSGLENRAPAGCRDYHIRHGLDRLVEDTHLCPGRVPCQDFQSRHAVSVRNLVEDG